jgi:hypothetical protein
MQQEVVVLSASAIRNAGIFDDRISEPCGVRTAGWISLSGCQPNRVQLKPPSRDIYFDFGRHDKIQIMRIRDEQLLRAKVQLGAALATFGRRAEVRRMRPGAGA